ncbi:hypothetical protein ACYSNU_13545 [Enterococcus sp. LJL120]
MTGRKDCWQILEIAATTDERAIKKAYAKKLKAINVVENPNEFQELKAAFDQALQRQKSASYPKEFQYEREVILQESNLHLDFSKQLQELIQGTTFFCEIAPWQKLITKNNQLDLEKIAELQNLLAGYLNSEYYWLSLEVREFIIAFCQIDQGSLTDSQTREWLQHIRQFPDFGYSFYLELPAEVRCDYFERRSHIYLMFSQKSELEEIEYLIAKGRQVYPQDSTWQVLDCYLLLAKDHGLHLKGTFYEVGEILLSQPVFPGRDFIERYFYFLSAYSSEAGLLRKKRKRGKYFFEPYGAEIPSGIYHLLTGYIAYQLLEQEEMLKHWQYFEEKYWAALDCKELAAFTTEKLWDIEREPNIRFVTDEKLLAEHVAYYRAQQRALRENDGKEATAKLLEPEQAKPPGKGIFF